MAYFSQGPQGKSCIFYNFSRGINFIRTINVDFKSNFFHGYNRGSSENIFLRTSFKAKFSTDHQGYNRLFLKLFFPRILKTINVNFKSKFSKGPSKLCILRTFKQLFFKDLLCFDHGFLRPVFPQALMKMILPF